MFLLTSFHLLRHSGARGSGDTNLPRWRERRHITKRFSSSSGTSVFHAHCATRRLFQVVRHGSCARVCVKNEIRVPGKAARHPRQTLTTRFVLTPPLVNRLDAPDRRVEGLVMDLMVRVMCFTPSLRHVFHSPRGKSISISIYRQN